MMLIKIECIRDTSYTRLLLNLMIFCIYLSEYTHIQSEFEIGKLDKYFTIFKKSIHTILQLIIRN